MTSIYLTIYLIILTFKCYYARKTFVLVYLKKKREKKFLILNEIK